MESLQLLVNRRLQIIHLFYLHVYVRALMVMHKNTADSRKKCTEGVSGSQSHQVSSLVMMATPEDKWCSYYEIHTLWNKNDCKLMHNSV